LQDNHTGIDAHKNYHYNNEDNGYAKVSSIPSSADDHLVHVRHFVVDVDLAFIYIISEFTVTSTPDISIFDFKTGLRVGKIETNAKAIEKTLKKNPVHKQGLERGHLFGHADGKSKYKCRHPTNLLSSRRHLYVVYDECCVVVYDKVSKRMLDAYCLFSSNESMPDNIIRIQYIRPFVEYFDVLVSKYTSESRS
jgi:hypothetical protein